MSHAPRPQRTADLLMNLITEDGPARITINDLMAGLGDRAFGLIMLLFALPNCIPAPPGIGSVLGLPLVLFSIQLMRGQHKPWLPKSIGQRDFSRTDIRRILFKAAPLIRKLEAVCKPRLRFATEGVTLRLLGFLLLLLAGLIVIPFPGTNWLPAIATAVISIGLIERDGLIVLSSALVGAVAFYISGKLIYGGLHWVVKEIMQYW